MSARGITVVGASAGSGKTYRLTQEVSRAIDPKGANPLPLDGLVAVTYTRKAHAELTSRIRQELVRGGAFAEALRLPLAYLGTVHAACLRLLQEFAIDAGLSPNVDVLAGDAGRLLRQSLEASMPPEARARLDVLAMRFKLKWRPQEKRVDWLIPVADIMDLARSNRIAPASLPAMAERSASGLLALLPAPEPDGAAIDAALAVALADALAGLKKIEDPTAATRDARATMEGVRRQLTDDEILDWPTWGKLAGLKAGAKSNAELEPVREAAARFERHPRFRAELHELTLAVFDAARTGLAAYQGWKEKRQVVDYVDLLDRALDLVGHPRVASELRERLKLAVVDEFQDTSPIQLALFVKLHGVAGRSVWVGDRKQCIFEYAGADPRLMDDVARWVAGAGGAQETLGSNWRSRPELAAMCSELFAAALARHGFTRDEVVVTATRTTPPEMAKLPPLGLWILESKNKDQNAIAFAAGVERMLANAGATPVLDRTTGAVRDVRPGDIAILVATNDEATHIASALHARGIRSALARPGLLAKPEGVLVDAALRWLLDAGDTLASARLDVLLALEGEDPDAWLEALLAKGERPSTEDLASEALSPVPEVAAWRTALEPVRARLGQLSPCEAVDEILRALDVVQLCLRWPDATQRVANLDALRGLVETYEGRCAQEREAGTVAGLLRFFDDVATPKLNRSEIIASDDQHVPTDDGAVIVMTYHRSKGLEWPVVILGSLDRGERRDAFDVAPESDHAGFEPTDPLAGRWIRYWPEVKGGTVKAAAEDSAEGRRVKDREERERARLLYVGFTRARDHMVLALRTKEKPATKKVPASVTAACDWLDTLADHDGAALLGLPVAAGDGSVGETRIAGNHPVATRVWRLASDAPAEEERPDVPHMAFVRGGPVAAPSGGAGYRILPSNARADWPELVLPRIGEVVELPGAMPMEGTVLEYNKLGDAVHAFLAADVEGLAPDARQERARRIVSAHGFAGQVRPEALVGAGDRLRGFVHARWPGAVWHREVSLGAVFGEAAQRRALGGSVDLLLETAEGYVLFDHKTFPGRAPAAWVKKAEEFLPQFAAYARGLEALGGKRVVDAWVHLPVGGGMVRVDSALAAREGNGDLVR